MRMNLLLLTHYPIPAAVMTFTVLLQLIDFFPVHLSWVAVECGLG